MTMTVASPQTIIEIIDDVFLPLAANFGKDRPSHLISDAMNSNTDTR